MSDAMGMGGLGTNSLTSLYLTNPELANALRQRMFAQSLAQDAGDSKPIQSHWQGINKIAQGLLGGILMNRADDDAKAAEDRYSAQAEADRMRLASLLAPGVVQAPDQAAPSQAMPQPGQAMPNDTVIQGIHWAESNGSMAPGVTGDGGKAAGVMQVHEAALADANRALGTMYTMDDITKNPELGKKIGKAYYENVLLPTFGGDQRKAVAAYHAGPKTVSDAVAKYGDMWEQGLPEATRNNYLPTVFGKQTNGQQPAPVRDISSIQAQIARIDQALPQVTAMVGARDPRTSQQARVTVQALDAQRSALMQQLNRAQTLADRPMQTVELYDPASGQKILHEMTPNGPGRVLGPSGPPKQMQTTTMIGQDGRAHVFELTPNGIGRDLGHAPTESITQQLPHGYAFNEGKAEPIPGVPNQQNFSMENTLRDEFAKLTTDFRTVQSAYENIRSAAGSKNGAGDMSLLYSYVKILDPGSVVRESEFATAAASGSFGDRVQGAVQRIISGQRLPDDLRDSFVKEAKNIYNNQLRSHNTVADQYEALAKRYNLDPDKVVTRYNRPQEDSFPLPPGAIRVK